MSCVMTKHDAKVRKEFENTSKSIKKEVTHVVFQNKKRLVDERSVVSFQRIAVMSCVGTFCQENKGRRSLGVMGVGEGMMPDRKAR